MANVSMDETLFYQYMINNNSTSTMLNALSGNSSDDSSYGNMAGILSALQSSGSWGTGSISDVSTLLGGIGGELSGLSSLNNNFANVLAAYTGNSQSQLSGVVDQLQQVLQETSETESQTKSYQTIQEIYTTLAQMYSGKADTVQNSTAQSTASTTKQAENQTTSSQSFTSETDFENITKEMDQVMEDAFTEIIL